MEQIQYLNLARLRNNEHYQFMSDARNKVEEVTPAVLSLDVIFPRFAVAHDELNATLLVDPGSVKTEQLTLLDTQRDSTWSALGNRIRATLNSPVTEEVESAKILQRIFDLYGNIRQMSYNEETAALTNLIEDLEKSENAAHSQTLGISSWVAALKQQNTDFQSLLDARNAELAGKASGDVKAARAVIDPIYKEMTDRLNAMVTLEMTTPEMQRFIRELNQRIKYYDNTLTARAGRNAAEEEEEEINPPVTPL
jgi:SMC interacting uncharacterized protein involved in chromosome segregation